MPKYKHGSGSIYKRGKTWWITYYVNGQQVWESAKTKDKAEARKTLQTKIGQRSEGRLVVGADKVTYKDLIEGVENEYKANGRKSLDKVQYRAKHLAKAFAGWRALDITVTELRAYITNRQEEGASNAEINRELSTLRRGFNLALQAEKILRMPHFPRLQESAPRAGFFEEKEFNVVLQHLPACLQPPMSFAYLTGWRCRSEILSLQWRNVDFEAGTVRLDMGSTKNKDGRIIYMPAALRTLLEERRQKTLALQRQTGQIIPLVFHDSGHPIVNYDKRWREACKKAGVPDKLVHDFRRTAVRNMVRAGIPERVAMQMAGHKTRSVFDRYHIVSDGDLQEAARRLEVAFPGQTMTKTMTVTRLMPSGPAVTA
ncbi:MAG: tyrosine-type recombinase/integrase [Candidatus Binatia bacterium]